MFISLFEYSKYTELQYLFNNELYVRLAHVYIVDMFLKQFKETPSWFLIREKQLWTMCCKCCEYVPFSHYGSIS